MPLITEPLEIKHPAPAPGQMVTDYRRMFWDYLRFTLGFCVLIVVLLVGWFVTPSSLDPSANIVLRVLAFIDAYFLVGFGVMFALWLALRGSRGHRFILPLGQWRRIHR